MANDNIEWSSEEMLKSSNNWSLAGDVAILNNLKKFSQNLLSDTESLSAKVDNLLNNFESVSLKLELTKNEFQSLRNTQFIENRVYEDDETLENDESKVVEKGPSDKEKENAIKDSISQGLKVIQKYYDKVELSLSDSEGEGNEKSYVLQPKDLYADRPLPHLVGTQDWYKKWHVGLLPSDSESESEKEQDVYSSNSDSEENLPKNRMGSETSSELDFTNKTTGPVANSTFNETQDREREIFHSSDESSEQSSSLPVKAPISNKKFAEQLAAKLGDVITGTSETSEIAAKPPGYGNLFSDEPPPVDELDDTILPKSAQEGLFPTGRNLFAEDNENDLFSQEKKTDPSETKSNEQKPALYVQSSSKASKSRVPKGLFDESDSSSEEDMLSVADKRRILSTATSNPYIQPYKTTVPFVDDQPPDIRPKKDGDVSKKKPVGGVAILGKNTDIFTQKLTDQIRHNEKVSGSTQLTKNNVDPTKKSVKKKISLFDDSSDEEIFLPKKTNAAPAKLPNDDERKRISLFEDDDFTATDQEQSRTEEAKKEGIFDGAQNENISGKLKESNTITLFDEDILRPASKGTNANIETKKASKKISLFDEDDDEDFLKDEEDIFGFAPKKGSLFADLEEKSYNKTSRGLFDDLDDSEDFSSKTHDVNISKNPKKLFDDSGPRIIKNDDENSKKESSKGLFDDVSSHDGSGDNVFAKTAVEKPDGLETSPESLSKNTNETSPYLKSLEEEGEKNKNIRLFKEEPVEVQVETSGKNIFADTNLVEHKNKIDQQEAELKKSNLTTEVVDIVSDVISIQGNDNIVPSEVSKIQNDDLKQDKKEALGRRQRTMGVFDSSSEKSSDEENFSINNVPVTESISTEKKLFLEPKTTGVSKPDENITSNEAVIGKITDNEQPLGFAVPPSIGLFDPTPPPVDWDATSDNSAESDTFSLTDGILDRTNYNQSQPTSSSLFDEAPPSLNVNDMNYSSGIGRDYNITRVETDVSSFCPHASSSRRLSSDIFSEEQSQDSFFVTKNRTESLAQASCLEKITENTEDISRFENITPSGNIEDFEGNSSVFESLTSSKDKMVKTESIVESKKHVVSGNVKQKTDSEDVKQPNTSVVKGSPGKLKHNLNINVGALLPGATAPKNRPAIVKSISLDETDRFLTVPASEATTRPKLDPRSVTPTSKMVARNYAAELAQAGSFENLHETEVLRSVTKDRARIPVKRKPSSRKARREAVTRSLIDFSLDKNAEPPELANSAKKTPEEDKDDFLTGLNEKLKRSNENDNTKTVIENSPAPKGISLVFDKEVRLKSNKEDLFDTSAESNSDLFESDLIDQEKPKIDKPLFEDLIKENEKAVIKRAEFDSANKNSEMKVEKAQAERRVSSDNRRTLKVDDSEYFKIAPTKSPAGVLGDSDRLFSSATSKSATKVIASTVEERSTKKAQKSSLFSDKSDSDSDGDLFGGKAKLSGGQEERRKPTEHRKKANIFGDSGDSSEDDLFGTKTSKSASKEGNIVKGPVLNAGRVQIKTANVKKLENKEATEFDPLSGFK